MGSLEVKFAVVFVDCWCPMLLLFYNHPSINKCLLYCYFGFAVLKGAVVLCFGFIFCMLWYLVVPVNGGW